MKTPHPRKLASAALIALVVPALAAAGAPRKTASGPATEVGARYATLQEEIGRLLLPTTRENLEESVAAFENGLARCGKPKEVIAAATTEVSRVLERLDERQTAVAGFYVIVASWRRLTEEHRFIAQRERELETVERAFGENLAALEKRWQAAGSPPPPKKRKFSGPRPGVQSDKAVLVLIDEPTPNLQTPLPRIRQSELPDAPSVATEDMADRISQLEAQIEVLAQATERTRAATRNVEKMARIVSRAAKRMHSERMPNLETVSQF